jgi:DNA-binding NtrC family response regulator/putative methionine-R-sulfoxide reductase with GAF domain
MNSASYKNDLITLSTVLLTNLDEVIFFSKITGFIQEVMNEYKVLGFESLSDGSTILIAENGKALDHLKSFDKGQGLSGYVSRTKRAYYSNSVKRDPISSTGYMDNQVEAELCMPIMIEGSVIGTINIQSIKKDRSFGEKEMSIINNILNELNSPIRNIHLYLMAKHLNRELLSRIEAKEKELTHKANLNVAKHLHVNTQLLGISRNFLDIVHSAKKIAGHDFPILFEGKHGVGKKILARKIHEWSGRKGNLVMASCSMMNDLQLDFEIFNSKGIMVQANGGTIILEDIGSAGQLVQTKLIRALVTGEMVTVDTHEKILLNVRMIATSKFALKSLVDTGTFKEDLFHRLNTVAIKIPSLSERLDDIKVLSEFFLNHGKAEKKILTSAAIEKLITYHWPGNGHELKNVMERTYILTDSQYVDASHLPDFVLEVKVEKIEPKATYQELTLFNLEKQYILDTLSHHLGNKTRAAKALGITVKTLYNKLHNYGLIEVREQ